MGWNVKPSDVDGFPGAISLGRVVAIDNETGEERLEFRIFTPGESVPDEYIAPIIDRMKNDPDDHAWKFLDGDSSPSKASVTTDEDDDEDGYDKMSVEDLQSEIDSRGLEVEGTGANGNVLKRDLIAALEADDSTEVSSDNPFV